MRQNLILVREALFQIFRLTSETAVEGWGVLHICSWKKLHRACSSPQHWHLPQKYSLSSRLWVTRSHYGLHFSSSPFFHQFQKIFCALLLPANTIHHEADSHFKAKCDYSPDMSLWLLPSWMYYHKLQWKCQAEYTQVSLTFNYPHNLGRRLSVK